MWSKSVLGEIAGVNSSADHRVDALRGGARVSNSFVASKAIESNWVVDAELTNPPIFDVGVSLAFPTSRSSANRVDTSRQANLVGFPPRGFVDT